MITAYSRYTLTVLTVQVFGVYALRSKNTMKEIFTFNKAWLIQRDSIVKKSNGLRRTKYKLNFLVIVRKKVPYAYMENRLHSKKYKKFYTSLLILDRQGENLRSLIFIFIEQYSFSRYCPFKGKVLQETLVSVFSHC